jgi:hypothetical protein
MTLCTKKSALLHKKLNLAISAGWKCTPCLGCATQKRLNGLRSILRSRHEAQANPTPLDAYVRRYGFVREKIERLQRLADNRFGHDLEAIYRATSATSGRWRRC